MAIPYANTVREMPAPDCSVLYSEGMWGPAMFHYASEGCNPRDVARDHGFDICFVTLQSERDDDDPLSQLYADGKLKEVLTAWLPKVPGPEWKLAGQSDSEDGPVATFLRPASPS
jgi:hypothetical protein